jgi:hypothetical protein
MITKFEAKAPRANRIRPNRLAVVVAGAVMALAGAALWYSPKVTAQAGRGDDRHGV